MQQLLNKCTRPTQIKGQSRKMHYLLHNCRFLVDLNLIFCHQKQSDTRTKVSQRKTMCFQVCVAGHYVTVLLDPHSFDAVLHDNIRLDFSRSRQQLTKRVFGLQLPGIEPAAARMFMET